jgi:predicted CXXCH cytochrome family protein
MLEDTHVDCLTVNRTSLSAVRHPARGARYIRRRSSCLLIAALVAVAGASSMGVKGCASTGSGIRNDVCLTCHNGLNAKDVTVFRGGPHKDLQCEDCHGSGLVHARNGGRGGLFINSLNGLNSAAKRDVCKQCHETEVDSFNESTHAKEGVLSCVACHDVHAGAAAAASSANNEMCLRCHHGRGFPDDAAVEAHTFHSVDPAGSGASRCVKCHLVPIDRQPQPGRDLLRLGHSLVPAPPQYSIDAADAGTVPVPPNSCSGVPGCHDGSVITAPVFHVDDRGTNVLVQILYDERYGPPAAGSAHVAPE